MDNVHRAPTQLICLGFALLAALFPFLGKGASEEEWLMAGRLGWIYSRDTRVTVRFAEGMPLGERRLPLELTYPSYPVEMVQQGVAGTVTAEVQIAPDGNFAAVRIIKASDKIFATAVSNAVKTWKFAPLPANATTPKNTVIVSTFIFDLLEK